MCFAFNQRLHSDHSAGRKSASMNWLLNISMKSIDVASSRSPSSTSFLFLYLHDSYKDQAHLVKQSDFPNVRLYVNPSKAAGEIMRAGVFPSRHNILRWVCS